MISISGHRIVKVYPVVHVSVVVVIHPHVTSSSPTVSTSSSSDHTTPSFTSPSPTATFTSWCRNWRQSDWVRVIHKWPHVSRSQPIKEHLNKLCSRFFKTDKDEKLKQTSKNTQKPGGCTMKQDQHRQAFFALAGLTKQKTPIIPQSIMNMVINVLC